MLDEKMVERSNLLKAELYIGKEIEIWYGKGGRNIGYISLWHECSQGVAPSFTPSTGGHNAPLLYDGNLLWHGVFVEDYATYARNHLPSRIRFRPLPASFQVIRSNPEYPSATKRRTCIARNEKTHPMPSVRVCGFGGYRNINTGQSARHKY